MLAKKFSTVASVIAMVGLAGCGTTNTNTYPAGSTAPVTTTYPQAGTASTTVIAGYGVVQGIELVPRQSAGIGAGTIAGAVVGGVLGNQVGSGTGRAAATVAGAAGGALAGRALENNAQGAQQVYRIVLRMDDGSTQSLIQESQPSLRIGDRIRVVNGVVERL